MYYYIFSKLKGSTREYIQQQEMSWAGFTTIGIKLLHLHCPTLCFSIGENKD